MKRKAILIESSNVTGLDDLPGARVDVANWKNFLLSDLGGAWDESEIVTLHKPASHDVDLQLNAGADGYCFVAYSGHGRNGSVALNEYWVNTEYSIDRLKPKGQKGTLIIDSCRGVAEAKTYVITKAAFANQAGHAVALNALRGRAVVFASVNESYDHMLLNRAGVPIKSRKKWDDSLISSLSGVVQMQSCAEGQGAEEDPASGGYYTTLLMASADNWKLTANSVAVHTTKDAHDYAERNLPPQQTPEYTPEELAFPFAV